MVRFRAGRGSVARGRGGRLRNVGPAAQAPAVVLTIVESESPDPGQCRVQWSRSGSEASQRPAGFAIVTGSAGADIGASAPRRAHIECRGRPKTSWAAGRTAAIASCAVGLLSSKGLTGGGFAVAIIGNIRSM